MLVVYLTWKGKWKHVCMAGLGSQDTSLVWWSTRGWDTWPQFTHEGKRPVTLRFLCPTQSYTNQKGILYEDSLKKKTPENMFVFWFSKISSSDVPWRWKKDVKAELLAAFSNLFALFYVLLIPFFRRSTAHPQGARKDWFLTLLASFSLWFWGFFSFLLLFIFISSETVEIVHSYKKDLEQSTFAPPGIKISSIPGG